MRLGDIASVKAGNVAPKKGLFSERGIPFVRAGSLSRLLDGESPRSLERIDKMTADKLGMQLFPEGTILFAKSGMSCMTGNVYVLKEPCYVVSHLACVAIDNTELTLYLKHYFRWNKPNALVENPSFPSIRLGKIKDMEIRLPDARQIARWVSTLERIEGLMETHEHQLSLLDDLVKSRFVEMFGDPVENPIRLPCKAIASLGELKNGVNYRKGESGVEIRCLGVSDFGAKSELKDVTNLNYVSLASPPSEENLLKDGDVVFVRSNGNKKLVGRCMSVYPGRKDVTFSGFCIRLRITSDLVRIPYLVWSLRQPSSRERLIGRGANIQNLNQRILGEMHLPIPPLSLQDAFLTFAAEVDKSRFVVQQQVVKYNDVIASSGIAIIGRSELA